MPNKSSKLVGKTVLVTRPRSVFGQPDKLAERLVAAGARVIAHPVVKLVESSEKALIRQTLGRLQQFNSLVFVSATGVRFCLKLLEQYSIHLDDIEPRIQIAAIGSGTADVLENSGIQVDLIPRDFSSQALGDGLLSQLSPPFLLIRANRGSRELRNALARAGKPFQELAVYESSDIQTADPKIVSLIGEGEIDWITLTSSAIVRSTFRLFGDVLRGSVSSSITKLVTISPAVSQQAKKFRLAVAAEATKAKFDSMVAAMQAVESSGSAGMGV